MGPDDWTPKERTRQVWTIDLEEFGSLCRKFEYTAWRLETRGRYASDEDGERWKRFIETGSLDEKDVDVPEARQWRDTVRAQVVSATSSREPSGT